MSKLIKITDDYMDITTPIGRLSWVYVAKEDPQDVKRRLKDPGFKRKYKVTIMLPKNVKALQSLGVNPKQAKAMIAEVVEFKKGLEKIAADKAKEKFGKKFKAKRWTPFIDGDDENSYKDKEVPECNENFWLLRPTSIFEPTVIDKNKKELLTDDCPEGLYAGCWARVKLNIYSYDDGVGVGIADFIKKIANDEALATRGVADPDEAFDDDDLDDVGSLEDDLDDNTLDDDGDDIDLE